MKRITFRITVAVFLLFAVHAATGQDLTKQVTLPATAPVITGTALAERLRFTAPSTVVQMQLQIYADSGQLLFDVTSKGNVLDWTLQNGSGEHLVPGLYLCVVTVKTLSGKISQRIGSALVQEKQIELQRVDATQMTAPQQQAVGPIEENGALTILKAGETQATTVLANNGQEGQIIRDRGALSFRIGDFFSGNDKEQMRLTEEGNLGIGTAKPRVKLDVAGTVRAQQGFMFNDGSTLNVNEKGALILTASDGTVAPNTAGTGTQNHLAKWLETGGAGTLGDSSVTELANGFVGIGTTNPQVRLDVVDDTSGVGGFQLTNHTNGSTTQLQNRLVNNAGAFAYYGITSSGYTQAPILSNRAFFGSYQVDAVIWTQTANDILFATNGLSAATERMRIKSSGNVGVGTNNPQSLLDVAGNINTSTQYNIGGNRVVSIAGTNNTFVGNSAGANNTGGHANSFFGSFAGFNNTSGNQNSFFGFNAGVANIGNYNSFFGHLAGLSNTTGASNSFFGNNGGVSNTTGSENSFFGGDAGVGNTTGGLNSFFGSSTGGNNSTGSSNSFFGELAGSQNTTACCNSFFGEATGFMNTTGQNNAFFGFQVGYHNLVTGNSFFGSTAGFANTTGPNNSFFGSSAGLTNTTGTGNTIIGSSADVGSNNLTNAAALGANARVTQSNSLVLGSINGVNGATADTNVGIGTTAPTSRLHVAGNALFTGNLTVNGTLTATLPAGSANYIQNTTSQQISSNFNISDNGTAGGTLSGNAVNSSTQYNIGGNRILSIAGTNNTFVGVNAGTNNSGQFNSFFGFNAGSANTFGTQNSFFGQLAGSANTAGSFNSFFGTFAGSSNTTGSDNSFFGRSAGNANTTGGNNAFFGELAGAANNASDNSFFGFNAGNSNTGGSSNSFFGRSAGQSNISGASNSFFGFNAGFQNTIGNGNSFFGSQSGTATTLGQNNSFFGQLAGSANTTGTGNSFFGFSAGQANTTEGKNTFLGANSNGVAGMTNATAVGSDAMVTQSNTLVLGSINGLNSATADTNVGIGTTSPMTRLHVQNGNIYIGSPGQGLILKSPDGTTCRLLTIDNSGTLITSVTSCP